jgi:hypothetical protein
VDNIGFSECLSELLQNPRVVRSFRTFHNMLIKVLKFETFLKRLLVTANLEGCKRAINRQGIFSIATFTAFGSKLTESSELNLVTFAILIKNQRYTLSVYRSLKFISRTTS